MDEKIEEIRKRWKDAEKVASIHQNDLSISVDFQNQLTEPERKAMEEFIVNAGQDVRILLEEYDALMKKLSSGNGHPL